MNRLILRISISLLAAFLSGICTGTIHGEENRDTFTGNWGGLRSKLEKKGVTLHWKSS